ncbi:protein timeless homolog [Lineus longissimus]|uniref:protein timeless homolog n=1 Tax=Lineus longissimus TaxID=88925 RepID=UPI00315DB60D
MVLANVELQATCSALGYLEDSNYIKEPDCLETVKDLIRYLKREDETCDIRRQLGSAQIVQNDLIPILISYKDDTTLFDTVMRLLVNLTQPAYICFNNHIPELKDLHNNYMEVVSVLISYKLAFANEDLFAILTKKLGDLLQLDWEHRQEEDTILIERILILVRNILHTPPDPDAEKRTDDDASVHDQVLWALHTSGMEDLLLYIGSSDDERQFAMHVVEVISLMFREQTPEQLASAGAKRTLTEKERDEKELMMVREKERAQKKMNMMKYSTRHSRFGGTYVLQNVKSISDNNNMIYHRSLGDAKNQTYDLDKRPKKKSKNLAAITDSELIRRSTLSIRLFLKDFCVQFLENCYNPLMYAVKDSLNHKKTQENDETYYLWAMRFFMEFQRHYDFRVDTISETMSVSAFHYVQVQLTAYHEMILTEKKEGITWSKRMHIALRAYKELLYTLLTMGESKDVQLKESAKVLKSNIFYLMEYRDIFLILFKKFKQNKQSRSFLKDLVEATHIFMKMLEQYSKGNKHVMVQKVKKKKPKKKAPKTSQCTEEPQYTEEELESMWDSVSSELSGILQGRGEMPDDVAPFDAASEVEIEQQRADAMLRIQDTLREQKPGAALALLRAAREVWPEQDVFGSEDISPEDEFVALREIFMTYIPRSIDNPVAGEENNELDEEEDELEMHTQTSEAEFDFVDYVRKFANGAVLKPYILLLSEFKKNSVQINHYIIKILHRVAVDCKTPGLLFQISLFRVFQNFYRDPISRISHYKEMSKFGAYIMKKFFEASKNNEKIFVEIWFWKNVKESLEVVDGYGTYSKQSGPKIWTEEQDMELTALFEEYKDKEEAGMDTIDHILVHIMDQTKSRRQIIRHLIHLNLIGSSVMYRKNKPGSSRPRGWQEEQVEELRELYDRYKDCEDPLSDIINNMSHKRSKPKIVEKLQELGLIGEDQQLYRKRQRHAGRRKRCAGSDSSDKSSSDNDSESEGPEEEEPEISEDSSSSSSSEEEMGGGEGDAGADADAADRPNTGPVGKYLKQLAEAGLSDQVTWMQEYLRRTATDREEEDDGEPTPIVTFTEENEDAMENKAFKSMLKKLGVRPPANEQERFWRIPGELKPAELRDRADWLNPDFKGKGLFATDRFSKLKSMAKKKAKEERRKAREEKRRSREERRKAREERLAGKEERQQRRQEKMEMKMLRKEERLRKAALKKKRQAEEEGPKKFKSAEFVPSDFDSSSSEEDRPIMAECIQVGDGQQAGEEKPKPTHSASDTSSLSSLSEFDDVEDRPSSVTKKKTKKPATQKKKKPTSEDESSMPSDSASSAAPDLDDAFPITSSEDETENISLADLHKKATDKKNKSPLKKTQKSAMKKKSPVKKARKSPVKKSRLKRSLPSDSSEEDSDAERLVIDTPAGTTSQPKKRTRFMELGSDSEDDMPLLNLASKSGRDTVDGDEDGEERNAASFPATLFTQPPASDSDSDIDDHIPLRRVIKRKQIESDSDD